METERQRQATHAKSRQSGVFKERLLLASASPRRAEILKAVGWPFDKWPADIDETRRLREDPIKYVERLALEKASAVAAQQPSGAKSRLVLGADTVVLVADHLLGKPVDEKDAGRMLKILSGRWHEVVTSIALVRTGADNRPSKNRRVAYERTRVKFAPMTANEIEWYVATGEPMDKAGAYAIQGRGARFIERIEGDYLNIVGLPVRLLYKLCQNRLR
jgi:septum formation protein